MRINMGTIGERREGIFKGKVEEERQTHPTKRE
jgi:hypothetical protein